MLIITIILFGVSAFFRKLAVDKISPYQLQLYSSIIYTALIPVWLYVIKINNIEFNYDSTAIAFSLVAVLTNVIGAVLFGKLLQQSQNIGSLTVIISISPIVTFGLSMIFLGEILTWKKIIACGLAILSLIIFHI
jgi:drug/metabolite transporter (DMT)-like permease